MRRTRTTWTGERIARLGFLVGRGFDAKTVAKDPLIDTTPELVHRQAQRLGVSFREAGDNARLPPAVCANLDAAAAKRGVTRDKLIKLLLVTIGNDNMVDGILDDLEEAPARIAGFCQAAE